MPRLLHCSSNREEVVSEHTWCLTGGGCGVVSSVCCVGVHGSSICCGAEGFWPSLPSPGPTTAPFSGPPPFFTTPVNWRDNVKPYSNRLNNVTADYDSRAKMALKWSVPCSFKYSCPQLIWKVRRIQDCCQWLPYLPLDAFLGFLCLVTLSPLCLSALTQLVSTVRPGVLLVLKISPLLKDKISPLLKDNQISTV